MRSLVMHLGITMLLWEGKDCSVSLQGRFLREIDIPRDVIIYRVLLERWRFQERMNTEFRL